MQITVPPCVLAMTPICDRESSRYALGGIRFRKLPKQKKIEAVATDGRRMISATWDDPEPDAPFEDVIVGAEYCDLLVKVSGKMSQYGSIAKTDSGWTLQCGSASLQFIPQKGRFPRTEDVFDGLAAFTGNARRSFDLNLIVGLVSVMQGFTEEQDDGKRRVDMVLCGNDIIELRSKGGDREEIVFRAVLMDLDVSECGPVLDLPHDHAREIPAAELALLKQERDTASERLQSLKSRLHDLAVEFS